MMLIGFGLHGLHGFVTVYPCKSVFVPIVRTKCKNFMPVTINTPTQSGWARAFAKLAYERSESASGAIPLFTWAGLAIGIGCEQ